MSSGIPIESIPQSLFDEVNLGLQQFVVPLFILQAQHSERETTFIGSGTLVQFEGTYHVLTAAHVWNETRDAEQVGLVIAASPSSFVVPCDKITVRQVWDLRI